ncbi:complement resistance protein TraT [Legionella sp. WA2022007384]
MKAYIKSGLTRSLIVGAMATLTGCAATHTVLEHGSLQVSTKQSDTIFLHPVSSAQKTVYVSVRNTSDEEVTIQPQLKTALMNHGYKVLNNPDAAYYILQANILKIGKMSASASQSALLGGYESAIAGAVVGTAAGSFTNSTAGMVAGGFGGGLIGMAADSLVKEINYTMITDIQISEKVGKEIKVKEQVQSNLKNGSSTMISQNYSRDSKYQSYKTRIVSNANKMNLKFVDARPALEQGLVKTIAGIF